MSQHLLKMAQFVDGLKWTPGSHFAHTADVHLIDGEMLMRCVQSLHNVSFLPFFGGWATTTWLLIQHEHATHVLICFPFAII